MKAASLPEDKFSACNNDQGPPMCYLKTMRCDSIMDCSNYADEMDCKAEHRAYCNEGSRKTKRDGTQIQLISCLPYSDPDDVMCIEKSKQCDGKQDCPHGDDEQNC